jgi:hypothetical protein
MTTALIARLQHATGASPSSSSCAASVIIWRSWCQGMLLRILPRLGMGAMIANTLEQPLLRPLWRGYPGARLQWQ